VEVFVVATLLACYATLESVVVPMWSSSRLELRAPYLGTATLALLGIYYGSSRLYLAAGVALAVANIQGVNLFFGDRLKLFGLSGAHTLAIGFFVTMVEGTLTSLAMRARHGARQIAQECLVFAWLVLLLLLKRLKNPTPTLTAREALKSGELFLPPDCAQQIASLYEQARYSDHPISPEEADGVRKSAGV
jgi:hypothetical protein